MKNFDTMEREARRNALRTMKENRNTLIETFNATRESTPVETVKALVNRLGYAAARATVAETVNTVSEYDGRISTRVREWAQSVEDAAGNETLERFKFYQPSDLHSCHINQMGEAMMAYTPAEKPAPNKCIIKKEGSTIKNNKDIAARIKASKEWDMEDCKALCEAADMEKEWESADGDTFEKVVQAAAKKLGVKITGE